MRSWAPNPEVSLLQGRQKRRSTSPWSEKHGVCFHMGGWDGIGFTWISRGVPSIFWLHWASYCGLATKVPPTDFMGVEAKGGDFPLFPKVLYRTLSHSCYHTKPKQQEQRYGSPVLKNFRGVVQLMYNAHVQLHFLHAIVRSVSVLAGALSFHAECKAHSAWKMLGTPTSDLGTKVTNQPFWKFLKRLKTRSWPPQSRPRRSSRASSKKRRQNLIAMACHGKSPNWVMKSIAMFDRGKT